MDSNQNMQGMMPNVGEAPMAGSMPGVQMMGGQMVNGQMSQNGQMAHGQAAPSEGEKKSGAGLIKTIVIIIVSLIAVTFIGLFIWMTLQYNDVSADVNVQIANAVAEAREEQALNDEAEFLIREKEPYREFAGPVDYGQLSFEYPKTWSVYIASDASKGGDYNAYLNPIEVNAVSKTTINALRVTIRDKAFDDVVEEYRLYMDRRDTDLSVESVTVAGTAANRYTGTIPNTELSGIIVIFKIRDKTAILQTDSMLFEEDFNRLIGTVTFNA